MEKHILQWHITHKCNLRCTHCYQEEYQSDLTFHQIEKIFYDYLEFLQKKGYRGHINLTGGEPFLYSDLYSVLELLEKNGVTFGLLTNGTLLEKDNVEKLSKYEHLSFVQISLDGIRETHEAIRGKGSFEKSLKGLKLLHRYKITSMVSFTAHKKNYREMRQVIKIARKHRVKRFWTDRLIPIGNCEEILSTEEFLEFTKVLSKEAEKAKKRFWNKMTVHQNRALQFCGGGDNVYHCAAGNNLLTILANGDIVPCRRLPIVFGNVVEKPILQLYEQSEIIQSLNQRRIPKECECCYKAERCRGGLKCLTYAVTGELEKKDINCPISYLDNSGGIL